MNFHHRLEKSEESGTTSVYKSCAVKKKYPWLQSSPCFLALNYIKQLKLKDIFQWTPLFAKKKFHTHEYDIPLDGVCH